MGGAGAGRKGGTGEADGGSSERSVRNEPYQAPAAVDTGVGGSALEGVLGETVALFHRLRWEAEQIHGQGERSSGRRGILRSLDQRGPQTVPQMARARPASRQYIQRVVNELAKDGFVEFLENPAHKRSQLVALTPAGWALMKAMNRRERKLFGVLQKEIPEEELQAAAKVLRRVRTIFEGKKWRRLVAGLEEKE